MPARRHPRKRIADAAEEFRRLKGDPMGNATIAVMQAGPHSDIEIEPGRAPMPVRGVAFVSGRLPDTNDPPPDGASFV